MYFCHSFICFSVYPVVSTSECNSSKLRLGMFMLLAFLKLVCATTYCQFLGLVSFYCFVDSQITNIVSTFISLALDAWINVESLIDQ